MNVQYDEVDDSGMTMQRTKFLWEAIEEKAKKISLAEAMKVVVAKKATVEEAEGAQMTSQRALEKIQKDETYARFGYPPLVQPSTIEKWIMWAVLAEPLFGQQAKAASAGEFEQVQIQAFTVETRGRKAGA